jgi:glycosyltransferase involved in cell wall biosynthesis
MNPKLSCTLIIRNESATLRACLESIRPHVDELVIVDTGSTDNSPSIAKQFADKFEVWTGCNDAAGNIADFSAARNHALSLATGDACAWFDGDDRVRGAENLRKLVSEAYRSTAGQPFVWLAPYEYERDAAGRVVTLQWRERIVYPRAGFEWRGPVHEGLLGKAGTSPAYLQTDAVVAEHQMLKRRDKARNLRILEAYIRRTGETDQRMLHYLGAELMYNGRIGEAQYWFRRHASVAPWSDERALSLLWLAKLAFAFGDYGAARDWALKTTAVKSWPEPYWMLGMAYCELAQRGIDETENMKRAGHFLQRGFELDVPGTASLLMKDPTMRFDAHGYYAPVLMILGRREEAIKSAEAGLAGKPEQEQLKANLRDWRKAVVLEQVAGLEQCGAIDRQTAQIAGATLKGDFKVERREAYAEGARPLLRRHPVKATRDGMAFDDKPSGKLDIVFFLGHQLEPWTPRTLEANGMGGSETMAWEMAKRLAKLGHRVRVYAHCTDKQCDDYDGVMWYDEKDFVGVTCDILICSRRFDAVHAAKFKAAILWVHDVHVGEAFAPRDAVKFDFIWCLSNWHKEFFCSVYPWLSKDKVEVTRNGIDPQRFSKKLPRVPSRAIYSSSPDRGLAAAVAAWPAVRAAIPDAELHVYYGWTGWEESLKYGENGIPHCSRQALAELKEACARTTGVVVHGRVNQRDLAEAMLSASVWAFPTWFSETSCITAMEAQAAGLTCVAPPLAALAETVKERIWTGDFVADMVCAFRTPCVAFDATVFSLDQLAEDWQGRLLRLLSDATLQVVPRFHEAAQ